jgi:hypothetical protein
MTGAKSHKVSHRKPRQQVARTCAARAAEGGEGVRKETRLSVPHGSLVMFLTGRCEKPMSCRSRFASSIRSAETDTHRERFRPCSQFSAMMPAS